MTCMSEGNPRPSYHWAIELLDAAYNTTFPAAELVVDVCNLTSWSSQKNLSGTIGLKLTCHAQNMIRGKLRTASVQEMYDLTVFKNMDKVCGKYNCDYNMMDICLQRFYHSLFGKLSLNLKYHFVSGIATAGRGPMSKPSTPSVLQVIAGTY